MSLSPVAGIATIAVPSGGANMVAATVRQAAAITPALLFAFLFNSLLIAAHRRTHHDFETSTRQFVDQIPSDKNDAPGQSVVVAGQAASLE